MQEITTDDVTWTVTCEDEDIPIEGNVLASGDDATDRQAEQEIREKLDGGNPWAWCSVKVTGTFGPLTVSEHLGACSYESEEDFRTPGGDFDTMQAEVLHQLNEQVRDLARRLADEPEAGGPYPDRDRALAAIREARSMREHLTAIERAKPTPNAKTMPNEQALDEPGPCGCCLPAGVLWPVNGTEVQACDECAQAEWGDENAVKALQTLCPWIPIVFEPDRDEETEDIIDPKIGVYVIDLDALKIPDDAPPNVATRLRALIDAIVPDEVPDED